MEALFDSKKVTAALGISIGTLNRMLARGDIDSVLVGRRRKFTQRHLEDYLKRNEVKNYY